MFILMTCICIRYNNHYIYCTDRIQNNIVPSWLPRQLTIDQDFRHGHQHLNNVATANDKERVIKNKISSHLQTGVFFFVLSISLEWNWNEVHHNQNPSWLRIAAYMAPMFQFCFVLFCVFWWSLRDCKIPVHNITCFLFTVNIDSGKVSGKT